jgi:hypothetical protein
MSNNENLNRNRHDGSDNNNQSTSKVHGGEQRNGRLSQIKNHNSEDEDIPNEFISRNEDEANGEHT